MDSTSTTSSASPSVFVVVDPVQDYEESLTIWGVFGSLAGAQYAARRLREHRHDEYERWRVVEVQHWQGDLLLARWTFRPERDAHNGLVRPDRVGWHREATP